MTSDQPFIELDFTGRAGSVVFDTTVAAHAPAGHKGPYGPAVVKMGSGQLLPGLDAFLAGKKPGAYTVTLSAEQAFGKKQADKLKLVPLTAFGKDANRLQPGLTVSIGEEKGRIQRISGGRVVVDFNHPLAGQDVEYSITYHGEVSDPVKKVKSIVRALIGVDLPVEHRDGKTFLTLPAGFPSAGLVKEIEGHTGVTVTVVEVAVKPAAAPASVPKSPRKK